MQSGHAATAFTPVLCAGVGAKSSGRYAVRLASFRLESSGHSRGALGIVTPHCAASTTLAGLLSGRIAPAYGRLSVLDHDLTKPAGRARARAQVGVASRTVRTWPGIGIRGLVERAARRSGQCGSDLGLLVAAILDRLALTPWADVQLSAAPELVGRRARLAAACVHEPDVLIVDGLFDQLPAMDRAALASTVTELKRDTSIIALGQDAGALLLFCDQLLALTAGLVVGPGREPRPRKLPPAPVHEVTKLPPFDHAR
jgi:ABC-2 type transport system ATP-binding protein